MPSLSESARVSIDRAKLNYPNLSMEKKQELREAAVIALIKAKPYGQVIRTKEFQEAARMKTLSNTGMFLKKLVKKGVIIQHQAGLRTYYYTLPGEATVTRPADPKPVAVTEQPEPVADRPEFSIKWHYENDLKGFINWFKSGQADD